MFRPSGPSHHRSLARRHSCRNRPTRMGEFPFSFALQCAIAVEAEAVAEAGGRVSFLCRPSGRDRSRSRRRRGVGEFPFSIAIQGAIDRCLGAGGAGGPPPGPFLCRPSRRDPSLSRRRRSRRATPGPLSLSPFKARSIAVEAQAEPEAPPPGQWT